MVFDLHRIFRTQTSNPRVLPNNHRIRKAVVVQSSEATGGQRAVGRENVKEEEEKEKKEEEEKKKEEEEKKKEEAKEKAVERTQAIRNSLSKLRSKFDQIRK